MLADVLAEPLQKLAAQIGDRAAASVIDVSDEAAVKKLVDDTIGRYGRVDVTDRHADDRCHGDDARHWWTQRLATGSRHSSRPLRHAGGGRANDALPRK